MSAAPVLPVDGLADPLLTTHAHLHAATDDDSVYTDELDTKLKTRMQQARAYVWMHSRCGRWATFYSTLVTVVQCVASYAAGCLGAAGSGTAALTYTGTACSFLVGGISTLAKLKFSNFDAGGRAAQ